MSDLKYQGLLERVARQTARYEDEIANIREELTNALTENEQLQELVKELREALNVQEASHDSDGTD